MYIVFEGIDGSGKDKQITLLEQAMKKANKSYTSTREPGGSLLGVQIRELMLSTKNKTSSQEDVLLLFANRVANINRIVNPALERGEAVISNRSEGSTIAYQHYGKGVSIDNINMLVDNFVKPTEVPLVILLDIDVDTSIRRRMGTVHDKYEAEGGKFLNKVREGYLKVAGEKSNWYVIDGTQPIEKIHNLIINLINRSYDVTINEISNK